MKDTPGPHMDLRSLLEEAGSPLVVPENIPVKQKYADGLATVMIFMLSESQLARFKSENSYLTSENLEKIPFGLKRFQDKINFGQGEYIFAGENNDADNITYEGIYINRESGKFNIVYAYVKN
ncbi:hypothetical protein [Deinococcus maricopensis]|uniref:hypothetical protein n=1 Tax=Deinococcus maricopensis TaxID=309887 RepID=UPI0011D2AEF8|nr:hypothetical protein [Deinococcus maricopensis]